MRMSTKPKPRIQLRNAFTQIADKLVFVKLALVKPPKSFRLGFHGAGDGLVLHSLVADNLDAGDRETAPFVD